MTETRGEPSYKDQQRERLFESFFVDSDETIIRLKKQALSCELEQNQLRIIAWKMFLGLLSTPPRIEEWNKEEKRQRQQYEGIKQKYTESSLDEEDDPNINNPLSLDASSHWSKYFENEQLRKTIMQDVDRTYPEYTYFQQQWVKDMMMEILFIYSRENPDVSYKQGMHELLAPIIYLLDQEKMAPQEGSILSQFMNQNYIENDAYILFERLMKTTGSWFANNNNNNNSNNCDHNKDHNKDNNHSHKKHSDTPILYKCQHIYHTLLKSKDPGLYSYITSLKIEPQLFLLRWIRLLFGREFHLHETLTLWDAIFAYDKAFSLIDYISVSMLMVIRDPILSTDQNGVLQLLFKYPNIAPVTNFIEHGLSMAMAKAKPKRPPGAPIAQSNPPVTNPMVRTIGHLQPRAASLGYPKAGAVAVTPQVSMERELIRLRVLHMTVASRLETLVGMLQIDLLNDTKNEVPDTVLLAVAELKQIKDVMCGHLPIEALPPQPISNSKAFK